MDGVIGFYKTFTFGGNTKKCENKNLSTLFLFVQDWDGKG